VDEPAIADERERNRIRRYRIGFVFQTFQLFPVLRADENVEYFLTRHGCPHHERERVRAALEAVGLWEHRAKRPSEMSAGSASVWRLRALAKQPDVIIADERRRISTRRPAGRDRSLFAPRVSAA